MSSDPGDRKRKHTGNTVHTGKSIKELFTTQQKPHSNATAPLSPSSKRPKLDSSPPGSRTPPQTPAMSTANMYHFPSKRGGVAAQGEVVELGSSPPSGGATPPRRNGARKTGPNVHSSTGPKQLTVKNFRVTRRVDPKVFFQQTWDKVERALDTIFRQAPIDFSLEELYKGVENLCRQGLAKDVKDRLVKKCRDHVGGVLRGRILETVGRKDVDVLRATLGAWTTWNTQMVGFERVCLCLWLTRAEIHSLDLLLS